jgi:hypothetical protein
VIAVDTSVVVAFMNRRDDDHERVAVWMETLREDLFTTPLIIAEIDHLVSGAGGQEAALAFYEDLASGAYAVEWWPEAVAETVKAATEHRGLGYLTRRCSRWPPGWVQPASRPLTSVTSVRLGRSPGRRRSCCCPLMHDRGLC